MKIIQELNLIKLIVHYMNSYHEGIVSYLLCYPHHMYTTVILGEMWLFVLLISVDLL
jgi:hypothetical protein